MCGYIYLVWYARGKWSGHPTILAMKHIVKTLPSTTVADEEVEFLREHPRYLHAKYPREFEHQTPYIILLLPLSWRAVASSIDKECRRLEKFVAFAGRGLTSAWPGRRIVVTPTWILYSYRTKFLPICQAIGGRLSAVVVETRSLPLLLLLLMRHSA